MKTLWAICDPNDGHIISASVHTVNNMFVPLIFKTKKEAIKFIHTKKRFWTGVYTDCYIKKFYLSEKL